MTTVVDTLRPLKAPFPYFGGKRTVAALVWSRLGDPRNYIEPFAGSAAVLLLRPHRPKVETLNDTDCYLVNFWRATQHVPNAVVEHCDGPVFEADMHARHRWLVLSEPAAEFRERVRTDPHYYDPRFAGWWAWGQCMWIGAGWCTWSNGPERRPDLGGDGRNNGIHRGRPSLTDCNGGNGAKGILCGSGRMPGVHRLREQLPDVSGESGATGRGIHASAMLAHGQRPQLADQFSRGRGVHGHDDATTCEQRRQWILSWFDRLRDRLRSVRVCCGDWTRVCSSPSVTTRIGLTGVFLDPPYAHHVQDEADHDQASLFGGRDTANRDPALYASDSGTVAAQARAWCLQWGDNPQMRIALCGLAGEHEQLEAHGWSVVAWKANGGYGNRNKANANRHRERIWFSPHCLEPRESS